MRERPAGAEEWRGRLRLWSGCVLFTYVTTHLVNHSLGLVSLDAMEAGRLWFLALWRNPLGAVALYSAFLVHIGTALWSIYERRTWRMPAWEAAQLSLGLTIPVLLARHVVGTRMANLLYGQVDPYARVALSLWHLRPDLGLRQSIVLLVAWTHGCIGIHFWLRLRPWYPRVRPLLFGSAVLLPVLALLGFVNAGRTAAALAREPGGAARLLQQTIGPAQAAALERVEWTIYLTFLGALGLVLLARAGRRVIEHRRGAIRIGYPSGREVVVPVGFTILEASRLAADPARVGVRRTRALLDVPRPSSSPGSRPSQPRAPTSGACSSAWPRRPASGSPASHAREAMWRSGRSYRPRPRRRRASPRRGRSPGANRRSRCSSPISASSPRSPSGGLPYDVVFFLNHYFEAVGRAIERRAASPTSSRATASWRSSAWTPIPREGAGRPCCGAQAMARSVAALSRSMADDLDEPLRIGIGIHTGPAVVGQMGYGGTVYLTAVGDTVHVASRFQDLTKHYQAQLIISEKVAARAGVDASAFPRHEITVRNRLEILAIRVIPDAADLDLRDSARHDA